MSDHTSNGHRPARPTLAGMVDHLLGGADHSATDRAFAARIAEVFPAAGELLKANREFLAYAVGAALERGVRQFLDVGAGLPTCGNTHQVARILGGGARVVYADLDPLTVERGRELLADAPDAVMVRADVTDPAAVLAAARPHLDLTRPVAVVMTMMLHYVPHVPAEVFRDYLEAVAPGSMLVVSHAMGAPATVERAAAVYRSAGFTFRGASRHQLEDAFAGWELDAPGVARVEHFTAAGELAEARAEGVEGVGYLGAVIGTKPHPTT